jgi:hypothetical protein
MSENNKTPTSQGISALDGIPLDDLKEVVKIALGMQEEARFLNQQGYEEEQLRLATVQAAREMEITDEYLRQAVAHLQHSRDQQAEVRWRRTNILFTGIVVALFLTLVVTWIEFKFPVVWIVSTSVSLLIILIYIRHRRVNRRHVEVTSPADLNPNCQLQSPSTKTSPNAKGFSLSDEVGAARYLAQEKKNHKWLISKGYANVTEEDTHRVADFAGKHNDKQVKKAKGPER